MKRIVITLMVLLLINTTVVLAEGKSVTVNIPNFKVVLAGTSYTSNNEEFPLINYNGITYFPMTYELSSAMGLKTIWSEKTGLEIFSIPPYGNVIDDNRGNNKLKDKANVADYPISINGVNVDNSSQKYPILSYKYITYFPLTWEYAINKFGWSYSYSDANGLVVSPNNNSNLAVIKPAIINPKIEMTNKVYTDRLVYNNGDIYEGQFMNYLRNGYGTYYYVDGTIYKGNFVDGYFHGQGKMIFKDGSVLDGEWKFDEFVYPQIQIPMNIRAIATSENEIQVGWDSLKNADGYHLYYSNNKNGPWLYFENSDGTKQNLKWTGYYSANLYGLNPGETFYFKVTSLLNGFESDSSNIVYATTFNTIKYPIYIQPDNNYIPYVNNDFIKSKIWNDFDGFDYGNIYELSNGQYWKQTSFQYKYSYKFMPDVIIYKDGIYYKMIVDGIDKEITVELIN